jgi:HlyD family secretion protein
MKVRVVAAAYPNQPFDGEVLKIEPLAIVEQNVTMFAVLIKIPNRGGLLKPGMNADVEIEIVTGEALSVIPTAALRTEDDIPATALMLGMAENDIRRALGLPEIPEASGNTISFDGQRITLPDGVDAEQVQDLMAKRRSGGEFTSAERQLMRQVMQAAEAAGVNMRGGGNFAGRPGGGGGNWNGGGGGGNWGGGGNFRGGGGGNFGGNGGGRSNGSFPTGSDRPENATTYQFGGDYWVVAIRDGRITPVNVRAGLTDLENSEIVSGLEKTDKVLLLPTASLYEQQAQLQEFIKNRFSGGSPFQRQQQR